MTLKTNDARVLAIPTQSGRMAFQPVPDTCGYVRMLNPISAMPVNSRPTLHFMQPDISIEAIRSCDVLWANRNSILQAKNGPDVVDELARTSKPFVLDIDDSLFDIGDDHIEAGYYRNLKENMIALTKLSSVLTCSTQGVYDSVKRNTGAKNTKIIRNSIVAPWFEKAGEESRVAKKEKVNITYYGTNTHAADWVLIRSQLLEIALMFHNTVEINLIGVTSQEQMKRMPTNVRLLSPSPIASTVYPSFISYMVNEIRPDIILAPLVDTQFNKAKSELKVLEAIGFGAIPVYSAGFEYDRVSLAERLPALGVDTVDGWYSAIFEIVTNFSDYKKQISTLRDGIISAYSVENHAASLSTVFTEAYGQGNVTEKI